MKIAFIGCGHIAHVHMRFLKKIDRTVDIVCDVSRLRAEQFASQYGIANISVDLSEMLATHKPDVVHILVPPQYHFAIARQCLSADAHVFVEKPLCETAEEYAQLEQLARERQRMLGVDFTRTYNPMVQKARAVLESGKYGRIIHMQYDYDDPSIVPTGNSNYPVKYAKGAPPWFEKLRGGVTTDLLPHPLSLFLSFCPDLELKDVWGVTTHGIIEELGARLGNDRTSALVNISLHAKPLKNRLHIYCDKGSITLDLRNLYSVFLPHRKVPGIITRVVDTFSATFQTQGKFIKNIVLLLLGKVHPYDGLGDILQNFYTLAQQNQYQPVPYIEAEKVTRLGDEIIARLIPENALAAMESAFADKIAHRVDKPADILVTGGTGFIGSHVTAALLAKEARVRVLCRSARSAAKTPDEVSVVLGDLRSAAASEKAMAGVTTVIHCAAAMSGDWAEFYSSTVESTANLLAGIKASGVKRLVYVSSLGLINYSALRNGDAVNEDSPLESSPDKRGFYTKAKKEAEDLVRAFKLENPDVETYIVRPGLVYGPESNNNLANAGILLGNFLLVFGLGSRKFGLNYVENLAAALALLGTAPYMEQHALIQVVDPDQPTVREYINAHNAVASEPVSKVYVPIFMWRCIFITADALLKLVLKRNMFLNYRFNSNAKVLNYHNGIFGPDLLLPDSVGWREALEKSVN